MVSTKRVARSGREPSFARQPARQGCPERERASKQSRGSPPPPPVRARRPCSAPHPAGSPPSCGAASLPASGCASGRCSPSSSCDIGYGWRRDWQGGVQEKGISSSGSDFAAFASQALIRAALISWHRFQELRFTYPQSALLDTR